MYKSAFSFGVTRQYPYRWFTPVAIVGGVIALVLFSLLNFSANGTELIGVYTQDPNATIADQDWIRRWPTMSIRDEVSCEPVMLRVADSFLTNNTALTYTISSVYRVKGDGNTRVFQGAVPYLNNRLEQCKINRMHFQMGSMEKTSGQLAGKVWNADMSSEMTCVIHDDDGPIFIDLWTPFNLLRPETPLGSFGVRNQTNNPSLGRAQAMTEAYWIFLVDRMLQVNGLARREGTEDEDAQVYYPPIYKGLISFVKNETGRDNSITSPDYFAAQCFYHHFSDDGLFHGGPWCETPSQRNLSTPEWARRVPNVWREADGLAKSFQAAILADLGQEASSADTIFGDPEALGFFVRDIAEFADSPDHPGTTAVINGLAELLDFDPETATDADTRILPSVISTTYFCQIPRVKRTWSLIVSILVADLVFLQALWALYRMGVDRYTEKTHPGLNRCEGCGAATQTEHIPQIYEPLMAQDAGKPVTSPKGPSLGLTEQQHRVLSTSSDA